MARPAWLFAVVAVVAAAGCQAFVDTETGAGIGATCGKDEDCQASSCVDGLCTKDCSSADDCPEGTSCLAGSCQLPLRAAFLWVGDPATEDWTRAHEAGREAAASLPYLVESRVFPNVLTAADAASAIDQAVGQGFDVIFANSSGLGSAMQEKAQQSPDVQFLTCGGRELAQNHSSYEGRMYKAWYLAGMAAAMKAPQKQRLGMVASFVTPAVVRHVNAFTRGARQVAPDIAVEVRWIGYWHDPAPMATRKETALAGELVDTGCEVIAHQADNGLVVSVIEELAAGGATAFSIGHNGADSCPAEATRCIGAVYWTWAPLYRTLLDQIHRGAPPEYANVFENIQASAESSVVHFDAKDEAIRVELADDLLALAGEEYGVGRVFTGPFCFNDGQCVDAGAELSDDDLRAMCRFVEGVVEKSDPADPMSTDQPAVVPAQDDCAGM